MLDSPPAARGAGPEARDELPPAPGSSSSATLGSTLVWSHARELRGPEKRAVARWKREKAKAERTHAFATYYRTPDGHKLKPTQAMDMRTADGWDARGELDPVWERELAPARDIILKRGVTKTPCVPRFGVAICGNGHRRPVAYGCTSRRCRSKVCQTHAEAERTKLLRPLIVDCFGHVEWGKVVLTYAPELHQRLADAGLLAAARALAAATVEQFFLEAAHLPEKGWRLGVVSIDHPVGDGEKGASDGHREHKDGETWYPHHNFLFPLEAFGRNGKRKRLSHWIDLDELRARWRVVQERLLGSSLGRAADFWYNYAATRPAKLALCDYFPRCFADWKASAQRLVYYGAFGGRTLRSLKETAALREEAFDPDTGELGAGGSRCDCGARYIRVQMDEAAGGGGGALPPSYRLVFCRPDTS